MKYVAVNNPVILDLGNFHKSAEHVVEGSRNKIDTMILLFENLEMASPAYNLSA